MVADLHYPPRPAEPCVCKGADGCQAVIDPACAETEIEGLWVHVIAWAAPVARGGSQELLQGKRCPTGATVWDARPLEPGKTCKVGIEEKHELTANTVRPARLERATFWFVVHSR